MNEGTLTHDCGQTSGFGIGVSEVEVRTYKESKYGSGCSSDGLNSNASLNV